MKYRWVMLEMWICVNRRWRKSDVWTGRSMGAWRMSPLQIKFWEVTSLNTLSHNLIFLCFKLIGGMLLLPLSIFTI